MQIHVTHKEDARAIAEKITACNYDPEETTQKSKGKEKELHFFFFFPWSCNEKSDQLTIVL